MLNAFPNGISKLLHLGLFWEPTNRTPELAKTVLPFFDIWLPDIECKNYGEGFELGSNDERGHPENVLSGH